MSMEKKDIVPKSQEEIDAFLNQFKKAYDEITDMLKRHKAYFTSELDKEGKTRFYKVFKNNGELIFYENVEIPYDPTMELRKNN